MKTDRWVRGRRLELIFLLVATALTFVFFADGKFDLIASGFFYTPEATGSPWPISALTPFPFFYKAAPWLSGIILFGSLFALIFYSRIPRLKINKVWFAYFFLLVSLGPGLVINGVFKPNWGRPRPREVVELGGQKAFRSFVKPTTERGMSFPCGHCSVGFVTGGFWFALKGLSLPVAFIGFSASLLFGIFMSIGRIAAGAHFLSDAIWAALMSWWIAYFLFYRWVNVPGVLSGARQWHSRYTEWFSQRMDTRFLKIAVPSSILALTFASLLIVTPLDRSFELTNTRTTRHLVIEIDDADIQLSLSPQHTNDFRIKGSAKGFGFPWNEVYDACWERERDSACQITKKGIYTDFESRVLIEINTDVIERFELRLRKGKVHRMDNTPLPEDYLI